MEYFYWKINFIDQNKHKSWYTKISLDIYLLNHKQLIET